MQHTMIAIAVAALCASGAALACDVHATHDDTQASVAPTPRQASLPAVKQAALPASRQVAATQPATAARVARPPVKVAKSATGNGG